MRQGIWRSTAVALITGVLLGACSDKGSNEGADVTWIEGTVLYRERMLLPPGAEVEVELQDISRADAPADTLATVIMPGNAGPPYQFRIEYDSAAIDQRHTYTLRAVIQAGGKLLFTSTEHIDPFADAPIEIMVRRVPEPVAAPARADSGSADVQLEGVRWQLVRLDGEPATAGAGGKPVDLALEAEGQTVSGFSGCNRYHGTYRRDGASEHGAALRFGPLAGTLMACPEGTGLERRFLDALGAVDNFRLTDSGHLQLAAGGNVVAEFEPAP
ncbi:META domain-containing protein [Parahaliea maris]|uniref:META domain-containing protein n=1 Tax=Parahaliea maris TaxID=2716870 RepID=A0A5C9A1J9_9GAMM|nr:YbaY family lipoprotein [Parahaliea maris]TXS93969.1 META domain-containing protein [Parahaliea maris]